jgi:hypothetical protein
MKKEEDQSTSPAVIAARAKKGLALATGNPLDKIVVGPPQFDKKPVQTEETLIERVVSMMQRRKRALQMKRSKPRIVRARDIKKTRLATQDQLMRRAMRMAKTILRKRAAGARGTNYSKLSPAQKMNIDRLVEPRTKNLKAMATRLMPRVKAGEMKRLNAVRTHKSTKGVYGNVQNLAQSYEPVIYSKLLGERVTSEDLNAMFSMYEGKILSAVTAPIRLAAKTVATGGLVAHALSKPENLAFDVGTLAAHGIKKLSGLGKVDPDEEKKDKTDKYSDKMRQQALIQSKERTKQAQLTTKKMQSGPAKAPVSNPPTPKTNTNLKTNNQQASKPTAPSAEVKKQVQSEPQKSSIIIPQTMRTRSDAMQARLKAPELTPSQIRQQKLSAAVKAINAPTVPTKQPETSSTLTPSSQPEPASNNQNIAQRRQKRDAIVAAARAIATAKAKAASTPKVTQTNEGGLWDNIHAKRKRIKAGSGERMRKPGSEGAPTKQNFIDAAESLEESFIVDRASGYSGVYTAKDLGIKMQGGFALHPSVEEEMGVGFEGTNKLTNKYKKDTPGEAVEAFARMMRAKRKANTPC